jgi:hypothetical protein
MRISRPERPVLIEDTTMQGLRVTFARFSCIANCSTQDETGQIALCRKARLRYLFLPELRKPIYGLARRDSSCPVFMPDNDEAGEAATARRREAVGHGAVLRLPDGVGDVNDLAQQPDGEAIFHRTVRRIGLAEKVSLLWSAMSS